MNSLLSILGVLAFIYMSYGLLLYLNQRSILYYPTPEISHSFDEEIFENEGVSIRILVLHPGMEKAAVYFGGNGEAVAYSAPEVWRALPSTTVYMMNYRGYGGSTGSPSEAGIFADARHVFDTIRPRHEEVAVIGRSLGSGVAAMLAVERSISRLVLITPFDSVVNVAQGSFPFYPAALLVKDKYDSLGRVDGITVDTLVLVAELDRVIPRKYTDNLIRALSPSSLQVELLNGTDHNSVSGHPMYYRHITDFLEGE